MNNKSEKQSSDGRTSAEGKPSVYFAPVPDGAGMDVIIRKLKDLLNTADFDGWVPGGTMIAVKTHFGEARNKTHIPPPVFKPLAARIRQSGGVPFLTETSTLYKGRRSDSVSHCLLAHEHGFTPDATDMPVILADGIKGEYEIPVKIRGTMYDQVMIAGLCARFGGLVCMSHPTGHIACGFGGAIKNLGMGLASRKGKLEMHSAMHPSVNQNTCAKCWRCEKFCPENAIERTQQGARIDPTRCIGCGECLVECSFGAIKINWGSDSEQLQKKIAEHAYGVIINTTSFHINYCINFTADCDCMGKDQKKACPDIGLFGGTDPVAVDQACIDYIRKVSGQDIGDLAYAGIDYTIQLRHAEEIGMGSRKYNISEC